ncbi:MAG: DUF308 domain-containing protein, partial [Coriobacteriia bacterium]|nr:DUF308 domain-containing protein [Coriobacteriia bacterium]
EKGAFAMLSPWPRDREAVRRSGWIFLAWGVLLVLLGVALLAWPELTGAVLVALAGAFMAASGIVLIAGAVRRRSVQPKLWTFSLVPGVALTLVGAIALFFPDAVSTVFLMIVAVIALLVGLNDIAGAIVISPLVNWWWLRLLRGVLLVGIGVFVLLRNISGLVVVGTLLGLWVLVLGAVTLACGAFALARV